MHTLNVDIETFSPVDLLKCGVYRYAEHPDFEVMLFGYSVDGGPRHVVDLLQGEEIPKDIVAAIFDPDVIKRAFNANFETVCLSSHFGRRLPIEQWRCTSVLSLTLGLPGSLAKVAEVCGMPPDKQKMGIGSSLIRFFCIPCKPTKKNGERTRNFPHHDPAKWQLFKDYCAQDVTTEMAVCEKLIRWDLPAHEWELWFLDQEINGRGMGVDLELVESAIWIDAEIKAKLTAEFSALTGVTKATQVARIKKWLSDEHEITAEGLDKEAVKAILKTTDNSVVERALRLRQELSKSSVSKYAAIARSVCQDGRVRGLLQFCGANRTWRWAGRIVQIQNLPKSDLTPDDLAFARELVKRRDIDTLRLCYGDVSGLLSELIRSAFVAAPGYQFHVVDFSAIEARVVAWASGCEWRMEVFRTHGKIYEASAEQMFKLPPGSVGKKSPLRQKGKIAELALGYLGGPGALITMGALKMGLKEEELQPIVDAWREANPEIVSFARQMEADAKRCIRNKVKTGVEGRYWFRYESGMLFMDLPSGRSLCYVKPRMEKDGPFTNITYDGLDQETKQWTRIKTYAGKLLENWTQAVARDCLAVAMTRVETEGFPVVGHVHDEAILETQDKTLEEAEHVFSQPIPWAPELPLRGDGFTTYFYRKDT